MTTRIRLFLLLFIAAGLSQGAYAQGDVTNQLQVLSKMAFMGKSVSNELVNISTNQSIAADLRQYAATVLANHDTAGTNSYADLESFMANWSITSEPTVSSNLISLMKQTLEYGISGRSQLETYAANTNIPPDLRQVAERMIENIE
jgi:predicted aminopeptidase